MTAPRRPTQRIGFTMSRLAKLETPSAGRAIVHDAGLPGLCVILTPSGSRTFYCYSFLNGRPVQIRIGAYPAVSVERAREICKRHLDDIAAGVDPREKRQARREEPTFDQLFEHWREKHGAKLRSLREWERIHKAYISPGWASRRLGTIRMSDVANLHLRIGEENGKVQANRVLAFVKMVFSKADGLGWNGANPAAGVEAFDEVARDRYLTAEELPRFFRAMAEEPNPVLQAYFATLLFTAARRGTVQRMKWSDLDLACPSGPYWRCPMTKAGKPMIIPLVVQAVQVLLKLRELAGEKLGEYVFPAQRKGKRGAPWLADPMPAWRRLCKRAGIEGLTLHDLRRSGGSWASIAGVSMRHVAEALGHAANSQATAIYSRLNAEAPRLALSTTAQV